MMNLELTNQSWEAFKLRAHEAMVNEEEITSPKQGKIYKVTVINTLITITRESKEPAKLGKKGYWKFLDHFNENNGRFKRSDYSGSPTKMSTIIQLHSQLSWDEGKEWMIVIDILITKI